MLLAVPSTEAKLTPLGYELTFRDLAQVIEMMANEDRELGTVLCGVMVRGLVLLSRGSRFESIPQPCVGRHIMPNTVGQHAMFT